MTVMAQLPDDQLAALRSEDVQLYLASQGWKRDDAASTARGNVYRYPAFQDAEALLPARRDLADYTERMGNVVQMLAAVEQRSVWQVMADLSTPPADVLRLQVTAPDATLGAVPLAEGIRLIEGGRELLSAAACSAHQIQAYYPRLGYKEALAFLETCQLGQTERGSFVATIMAPIPPQIDRQAGLFPEDDPQLALGTEPFARRATLRLMLALDHIRGSIHTGSYDTILAGVDRGVSANLCEAIASMKPGGDQANLQIRMSWSRNRPRVPAGIPPKVSFSQTAFSIVQEAGRKLREVPAAKRTRIEGFVISLKAEASLRDDFEGLATLRAAVGGAPARVQVVLNRDDYVRACDAHRDARPVAVTGLLQHETKLYRLLEPQGFQVSPQTASAVMPTN
jgi:hypothetical protein